MKLQHLFYTLLLLIVQVSSFICFQSKILPRVLTFNLRAIDNSQTSDDDNEQDIDINLIEETVLDQSIEKAVRQMLDDGPKEVELSPSEKFKLLYETMKNKDGKTSKGPLDPAQILASLFTEKPAREPFDDVSIRI